MCLPKRPQLERVNEIIECVRSSWIKRTHHSPITTLTVTLTHLKRNPTGKVSCKFHPIQWIGFDDFNGLDWMEPEYGEGDRFLMRSSSSTNSRFVQQLSSLTAGYHCGGAMGLCTCVNQLGTCGVEQSRSTNWTCVTVNQLMRRSSLNQLDTSLVVYKLYVQSVLKHWVGHGSRTTLSNQSNRTHFESVRTATGSRGIPRLCRKEIVSDESGSCRLSCRTGWNGNTAVSGGEIILTAVKANT